MRFDRMPDAADDPLVLRQITDEIMFELRSLSGQTYVNQYCKRASESVEESAPARVRTLAELAPAPA